MRCTFAFAAFLLSATPFVATAAPAAGAAAVVRAASSAEIATAGQAAGEASVILVREAASGGGRQRQNRGVRGI